jgi:hypothetical protein
LGDVYFDLLLISANDNSKDTIGDAKMRDGGFQNNGSTTQ